jgi:K+-sensing histidine kinase KdpD
MEECDVIRNGNASPKFINYLLGRLIVLTSRARYFQSIGELPEFSNPKYKYWFETELKHCLLILGGEWGSIPSDVGAVFNEVKDFYPVSRALPSVGKGRFIVQMRESDLFLVLDNLLANANDKPTMINFFCDVAVDCAASVEDNGPGMSEAQALALCSKRFEDLEPGQTKGGIGLLIARAAIAAAGGTLEVETAEGHGSLFRVRLPLAEEKGK